MFLFFFFKQKTAYEMRISDWSSDVCSSDLAAELGKDGLQESQFQRRGACSRARTGIFVRHCRHWHLRRLQLLRYYDKRNIAQQGIQTVAFCSPACREIGRASCRERVCQYV